MFNILVVDDSELDRRLATQLLTSDESLNVESATNGRTAVERLEAGGVDLVVTDLQMPDIDGLELVVIAKTDYPSVPVVLMTGHGSETIAIEALKNGAANYVPKALMKEHLAQTVKNILSAKHVAVARKELLCIVDYVSLELTLPRDDNMIEALVEHVEETASGIGFQHSVVRLDVALREAIIQTLDYNQSIKCRIRMTPNECRIILTVTDDDKTIFDPSHVPQSGDISAFENNEARGFFLLRSQVDRVYVSKDSKSVELVLRSKKS